MPALSRWFDRALNSLGPIGSATIILIAVLSVIEIGRRYLLNAPSIWASDLVTALAAITYIFAGPYAFLRDRHVEITVISERFSARLALIREMVVHVVGAVYMGALLYGAVQMAGTSLRGGERTGTGWDVPLPQITKVALVIALAIFLVLTLRRLVQCLVAQLRKRPLPPVSDYAETSNEALTHD